MGGGGDDVKLVVEEKKTFKTVTVHYRNTVLMFHICRAYVYERIRM